MTTATSEKPERASALETQKVLLAQKAIRAFVPVRRDFVQRPPRVKDRKSVLAEFVKGRDVRALRAYLFIIAITSSGDDGWTTTLNSSVWARALHATETAEDDAARAAVTKILTRLQDRRLITYERVPGNHRIQVTLLREDGSGDSYTRPGRDNRDAYFKIPHEVWDDQLIHTLGLPALAMLLVLSCERPDVELPLERTPKWYGWSADTAERGLKELVKKGLADARKSSKVAPLAPKGYTLCNRYTLLPPYLHRRGSGASDPETKS
ncbi:hypothetical protein OG689_44095 [Kitasatospora sp. NBC_00240]|uniref:hypothetical protein n=1 Tax=Kitasatospora sp. NBC_00240 TaxID=2903567 RepID=UPI002253E1C1|nr:hypothetical protein [Kitasatospora sp. NBC_00240]MCX5216119.1 hypothetical protein [Kitasatospora sp. NBC_00240]